MRKRVPLFFLWLKRLLFIFRKHCPQTHREHRTHTHTHTKTLTDCQVCSALLSAQSQQHQQQQKSSRKAEKKEVLLADR